MSPDESYDKHAEVVTSVWWGLAAIHRKPGGTRRLRIRWFRLFGSLAGLAAVFWLMIALGLYFWFKQGRGFQDEKFGDVLSLPFHWPPFHSAEHDKKMGDYFYHAGDWNLQNRHYDEAFTDYRLAVMKTPDNLDARQKFAGFSLASNKNLETYATLLEEGIPYALADNPDYINNYFVDIIHAQVPDCSERIMGICQQYLAQNLTNSKVRTIFALNLANAYIDEGDFDKTDGIIKKYDLEKTLDGVVIKSRLLWERGDLHAAPRYLEKIAPTMDNNPFLLGLLSRFYRDLGDLDKSRFYTLMRAQKEPTDVGPQIELLYINAKSGTQTTMEHDIENIITNFRTNAEAMNMLANFATDQGDYNLALRLYQLAREQDETLRVAAKKSDFSVASFALLVAEAYLTDDKYKETIDFLDEIRVEKPDWLAQYHLLFDSVRAVADYNLGQETDAQLYVNNLIDSASTTSDTLLRVANRFISHNGASLAGRLLAAANHLDPHNQAILAQLIATNLQLGNSENMDKNIHSLLQTRRPPAELLYDAYRQLAGDHFIFVPEREKLLRELGQFLADAAKKHHMDDQS